MANQAPAFTYLMERLELTFGRAGIGLLWTVSDARDNDDYADCSSSRYYRYKRRIAGRLIFYARGNHLDSAWTCLTAPAANGFRQGVGIDLWVANAPGRPTRLLAMQIVASARRA